MLFRDLVQIMPKPKDLKRFSVILIISYLQLILNLRAEPEQHFDASGHAIVGKNYSFMEMESCGYLSPKDRPQMRIINGDFARIGEFPWQVNIMNNWQRYGFNHICSGVLIHKNWVMTAAHCLQT